MAKPGTHGTRDAARAAIVAVAGALAACATTAEPQGPLRKETVHAVTASHRLVSFNAGQPGRILSARPLVGLAAGEAIVGIDYRVARGQLYALSDRGRLLRVDPQSGALTAVGTPLASPPVGEVGFDFNPTVDRIRVVTENGLNLRLHPDTGAQVDGDANAAGVQPDGALAYVAGDPSAGQVPRIVAAAYTYNKQDEKITTNYAIDARQGTLVMQGSREGVAPAVSPNTGRLSTVGKLGVATFARAAFDIADVSNSAFAALTGADGRSSGFHEIDLATGKARYLGRIAVDEPVRGIAIEP